ncbi:hypothetical protein K2173_010102 [Erythroxylum novogranatense]|uniref:Protein RIK n=1 Tax=Erythroxylum novogranatense TaxID=1862640 RepID=A0AAV8SBV2_9ROSI|nr:hypothetical protein K2173_010102 [Erythroxylum novogranatense]
MTDDGDVKGPSGAATEASQSRQRKKRKWDQPAESLISAGVAISGVVPLGNVLPLTGMTLPGVAQVSGTLLTNPIVTSSPIIPPAIQVPSIPQNTGTAIPKLNQPKIQDELIIAREIVINDAEPSVRYKLTKRQTQEEIQKCTGAVVITRGKYRPPNAPPDSEKPLYLHISSASHLKDTAERILAVDHAALMVEEMLKQGNLQPASSAVQTSHGNGVKALSTSVFLGFDPDPTLNLAARVRGPNDQYINHIMNETGATVVLRGRGSGNIEKQNDIEGEQPLHLFLSATNIKSLEDAKILAENLLDTISLECGASRVSSSKVYNAVPPPQQLLPGVHSSGDEIKLNTDSTVGIAPSRMNFKPSIPASSYPAVATFIPQGTTSVSKGIVTCGHPQSNPGSYQQPLVTGGTSYGGYGGIYPQATPLQQVALVLRQSPSPINSTIAPTISVPSPESKPSVSTISENDKRPNQKRKFQELPANLKEPARHHQGPEFTKSIEQSSRDLGLKSAFPAPASRKLIQTSSSAMPPPPPRAKPPLPVPRTMPTLPPVPKFSSKPQDNHNYTSKVKSETVPDTLIKLMEYGEDDDDPEGTSEESLHGNFSTLAVRKPFWAI